MSIKNKYRAASRENGPFPTQSIAIVEDSSHVRNVVSLVLGRSGFNIVFAAQTGEEILDAISEERLTKDNLNVVLLDYDLGDGKLDGLETAIRILRFIPTVRIIIMSANHTLEKQVVEAGLSFIKKPFSLKDIVSEVSYLGSEGGKENTKNITGNEEESVCSQL